MKIRIILLSVFLNLGFFGFGQFNFESKPVLPFVEIFTGTIDNKYSIHVLLYFEDEKVSGSYFYNRIRRNINLHGTVTKDGFITLTERDQSGNETGLWKGIFERERGIIGIWTEPDGSSVAEVRLVPTKNPFDNKSEEITEVEHSRYSGTYDSPFNDEGVPLGTLKVKYKGNEKIYFDIITTRKDGCTGYLEGVAKILSPGLAFYSGDGCEGLTFIFHGNQVRIKEEECMWHGIWCFFAGDYIKKK